MFFVYGYGFVHQSGYSGIFRYEMNGIQPNTNIVVHLLFVNNHTFDGHSQ